MTHIAAFHLSLHFFPQIYAIKTVHVAAFLTSLGHSCVDIDIYSVRD